MYICVQVVAEDLGSKFNAQAREAWRLVLLFILTELKRGFTQCLRDKSALRSDGGQAGQPTPAVAPENDVNAKSTAPETDVSAITASYVDSINAKGTSDN